MASFTLAQGMLKAHQLLLAVIARQTGFGVATGQSMEEWIREKTRGFVNEYLLTCDDEQVAAQIQEQLDRLNPPEK